MKEVNGYWKLFGYQLQLFFGCFGDCLGYTKKYDVDSCILPFLM